MPSRFDWDLRPYLFAAWPCGGRLRVKFHSRSGVGAYWATPASGGRLARLAIGVQRRMTGLPESVANFHKGKFAVHWRQAW